MGDDVIFFFNYNFKDLVWSGVFGVECLLEVLVIDEWWDDNIDGIGFGIIFLCFDREGSCIGLEIRGINYNNYVELSY